MSDNDKVLIFMASLALAFVFLMTGILVINYYETREAIKSGLQQCVVQSMKVWQKECK